MKDKKIQLLAAAVILMAALSWHWFFRADEGHDEVVVTESGEQIPTQMIHPSVPPPAAPPAPAEDLSPTALIQETPACASSEEIQFREIGTEELIRIYRNEKTLKFSLSPDKDCVRVGGRFILTMRMKDEPEIPYFRASTLVTELRRDGELEAQVLYPWLGNDVYLAPLCFDFCDRIVVDIPKDSDGKKTLLIDVRTRIVRDELKIPGVVSIPLEYRMSFQPEMLKKTGDLKGVDVVVLTNAPRWFRRNVLPFMRELKRNGAASVAWLYSGVEGMNGRGIAPQPPGGIPTVHYLEIEGLRKKGAKLVFVGPAGVKASEVLPGSLMVSTGADGLLSGAEMTRSVSAQAMRPQSYDLKNMPKDKKQMYVIYGYNGFDARPYYFMEMLLQQGYENLHWFRHGIAEVNEVRELGLATR